MAGLLDDLLSTLNSAQTPWAQEAMRRMLAGEDVAGADAAIAARTARKPAPVSRDAPPPSADVRNPGQSADPFQAAVANGPPRINTPADNLERQFSPTASPDAGPIEHFTGGVGPAIPQAAPQNAPRATPAPARGVQPVSADLADDGRIRPAPANDRPDFSQGVAPLAKFLGLDALGLDGGQRARVQQLTYDTLIGKGMDPKTAELVARQPELLRSMLPGLTADKTQVINNRLIDKRTGRVLADYSDSARQGPEVKEIEGPYGQKIKVMWDAPSRQYVPLRVGGEPAAQPAPGPAAVAPPVAPVAAPDAAPGVPQLASQPAPGPAAPAKPALLPAPEGFTVGRAVPKPPEGYVHKLAPGGIGYLYTRDGQPVFESKTEVDARGKQREKDLETDDKRARAGEQVSGAIEQLMRFPLDFGKQATERAIGPWSATNPNPDSAAGIWGTGISVGNLGQMIARTYGEASKLVEGGATPTEVRDRIETVTKNLAAVMKPLVRAPGEGAWSDKDQANLEAQIGAITRARTVDEYNRRLADIQENVAKVFKLNVPVPGTVTRRADAPTPAEEEMTAIERFFGKQMK